MFKGTRYPPLQLNGIGCLWHLKWQSTCMPQGPCEGIIWPLPLTQGRGLPCLVVALSGESTQLIPNDAKVCKACKFIKNSYLIHDPTFRNAHTKRPGRYPVYWPLGRGKSCRIRVTAQLGMTRLLPARSLPCCHTGRQCVSIVGCAYLAHRQELPLPSVPATRLAEVYTKRPGRYPVYWPLGRGKSCQIRVTAQLGMTVASHVAIPVGSVSPLSVVHTWLIGRSFHYHRFPPQGSLKSLWLLWFPRTSITINKSSLGHSSL